MTDLDELAVQVGREEAAKYADETSAILGARAMLAKLREMGLVVEWRPIDDYAPVDMDLVLLGYLDKRGKFAARSARYNPNIWEGSKFTKDKMPAFVCTMDGNLVDQRATHYAKLPKGPGHD